MEVEDGSGSTETNYLHFHTSITSIYLKNIIPQTHIIQSADLGISDRI